MSSDGSAQWVRSTMECHPTHRVASKPKLRFRLGDKNRNPKGPKKQTKGMPRSRVEVGVVLNFSLSTLMTIIFIFKPIIR